MSRRQSTVATDRRWLGVVACVFVFSAGSAAAAIFEFSVDPAQSWIEVDTAQSGMRFTVPGPFLDDFVAVEAQAGPGITGGTLPGGFVSDGTRSSLSGKIRADVRPTQVSFLNQSTLVTIGSFGTFLPGTDAAPATPAPANLAVHLEDALFGIGGDLALRNGRFSMFGQNLPITPSATPGRFTFSPSFALTPFWIDGLYTSDLNGVRSSLAATNIQPFSSNSVTASFDQLPGGGLRLTLPYDLGGFPFGLPLIAVPLPADLQVRATGQIVATAPEADGSLPAVVALLVLAWRSRSPIRLRLRPLCRGAVSALGVLLLADLACGPGGDFEPGTSVSTQGAVANEANASVDVGNGALTDSATGMDPPDATAEASVNDTLNGQAVTATETAERTERPFIGEPWSFRVSFRAEHGGGPLDVTHSGSVAGSWNYAIPQDAELVVTLPVTLIVGEVGGDPSDTHDVVAVVECDGQGPVNLLPNQITEVPIESNGLPSATGSCNASLAHQGSRSQVATVALQQWAAIYYPRTPAQSTPTACAAADPAMPYPISSGGCGDGVGTACLNDAQCAPGHYCQSHCLAGTDGDACETDDQCRAPGQGDRVCALGKCGSPSALCDPVAQTGCELGEKCDSVSGTTPQGVFGGVTRCTADGTVGEGDACSVFSTTPASSCAAGFTCEEGLCRRWCRVSSDCDAGQACDVTKGNGGLDPGRDLAEGDGGRCKVALTCLGCR